MKRAWVIIRDQPVYRQDAFVSGLRAQGYAVTIGNPPRGDHHGNVLAQWNRYAHWHEIATAFEQDGGQVIVAENGYLGVDRANRQIYSIADGYHNGKGCWYVGDENRFDRLSTPIQPWRTAGNHVLVCPNREFGSPGNIQPGMWAEKIVADLRKVTDRPIVVRPHPGNAPAKKPLAQDLENAWAVVIWHSSVGVDALIAGIPVWCLAPHWIAKQATFSNLKQIENPPLHTIDRARSMHALAWAQWTVSEISAGIPFAHLCNKPVQYSPA